MPWLRLGLPALATALVATLAATPAAAAPRLAIIDGVRVNLAADDADALAVALGAALEAALDLEVIAGPPVRQRLGDRAVAADCASRGTCLADLAAALEVDQILFLVVVGVGDGLRIEATWLDAASRERLELAPLLLDRTDDRAARFALEAPHLLPRAAPRPVAADDPPFDHHAAATVRVVPPPRPPAAPPRPRRRGGRARTIGLVVGGVGLALGGGSLAFALRARGHADDLEARFASGGTWDQAAIDLEDAHHRDRTLALALGATAGVAVITGVALIVLGGPEPAAEPRVALGAVPTTGGALLVGVASF